MYRCLVFVDAICFRIVFLIFVANKAHFNVSKLGFLRYYLLRSGWHHNEKRCVYELHLFNGSLSPQRNLLGLKLHWLFCFCFWGVGG